MNRTSSLTERMGRVSAMETHRTRWMVSTSSPRSELGVGLVGLFLGIVAIGLTISGSLLMQGRQAGGVTGFVLPGQAGQNARSGIAEALNWFRLRPSQPVLSFDPVRDAAATPPTRETDEPEIGLVRQFQIDGAYWGRYEVWKPWDGDPIPQRLAWRDKMRVRDISGPRGLPPGSVWKITCIGYVFRQEDPQKAFDRFPNRVLGSKILEAEIHRLALIPSGTSALSVRDGGNLDLGPGSQLSGGSDGAALTYPQASRAPRLDPAMVRLDGVQIMAPVPTYDDRLKAIFGVDEAGLQAMADMVITDEKNFPSPIPSNSIVFSQVSSMTLSRPLSGFGIVVHRGDLRLPAGSRFSGLLYVDGGLHVSAPAEIRGTVIVTGTVTAGGSPGFATLRYDTDVLSALKLMFGQYRLAGPLRETVSAE